MDSQANTDFCFLEGEVAPGSVSREFGDVFLDALLHFSLGVDAQNSI